MRKVLTLKIIYSKAVRVIGFPEGKVCANTYDSTFKKPQAGKIILVKYFVIFIIFQTNASDRTKLSFVRKPMDFYS